MNSPLRLPESRAHIAQIQSDRKKKAFALAKTVPWYRDKLAGIDAEALDDPAEWQKIPILDKDTRRK
jgi:phenylacetate-coenzyme A ligase PaaK-like adenylate-forming protein